MIATNMPLCAVALVGTAGIPPPRCCSPPHHCAGKGAETTADVLLGSSARYARLTLEQSLAIGHSLRLSFFPATTDVREPGGLPPLGVSLLPKAAALSAVGGQLIGPIRGRTSREGGRGVPVVSRAAIQDQYARDTVALAASQGESV
jgi:hypothetical protein